MEKILIFLFFVLLVVLLVYILTRRREEPEFLQGDAVDRVLYWHFHPPKDGQEEWAAGKAWREGGRHMTVALIRQGLGDLLDEEDVEIYDPVFKLGYTLGEEGKEKAVNALRRKVDRRDAAIQKLQSERDDLLHQLEHLQEQRPKPSEPVRPVRVAPVTPPDKAEIAEAWEEWGRSSKTFEEVMLERGWARATKPKPEPEPLPEPEPETTPKPLRFGSKAERNAAVVEYLKDHTNAEAAAAFDISESLVRNIKSTANKLLNAC